MTGISKQCIDKPVGRYRQRPIQRVFKVALLLRLIGYPIHILLTRDRVDLYRWILGFQLCHKILHTGLAAIDSTRMSREMSLRCKELREILVHPSGNLMMLPATKRRQQATIALRILPNLRQPLTHVLA